MIHDENTTEIEIPKKNVVAFPKAVAAKRSAMGEWIKDLDLEAPWIVRLIAVLCILILSMLIL